MKVTVQILMLLTASVGPVGKTAPLTTTPDVDALDRTATNYRNEGRLAEAEELNRRALKIANAGETVEAMMGLARTLCVETRYGEAEAVALEADSRTAQNGLEHARVMSVLALIYREQMRYPAAEQKYRESAAALEQSAGPRDPSTAVARADLGYVLAMEGKAREAQALLDRSLPVLLRAYGPARPEAASALTSAGLIYQSRGKFSQAARSLRRALEIDTAALGPESIRTANDAANLGYVEFQRHHYAQAETLVKTVSRRDRGKVAGPGSAVERIYAGRPWPRFTSRRSAGGS